MATTKIFKVTQTVNHVLSYCASDKTVEFDVNDDLSDVLKYAIKDKIVTKENGEKKQVLIFPILTNLINCPSGNAINDFKDLMEKFQGQGSYRNNRKDRETEPIAWHLVQSFEEKIPPELANRIGCELAMRLWGGKFYMQVSTHTNTENIHNHIVVCAWNIEGRKHHQNNEFYQRIRTISDELCDKYGLSVLENTRKQKLVRWQDKDGKTHYYEPTDRKNALISQRKRSEISTDDVNSYRNTKKFATYGEKRLTVAQTVRNDIDFYIRNAKTIEELLNLLRKELGYKINAKKKNGEWLKYISFQVNFPYRLILLDFSIRNCLTTPFLHHIFHKSHFLF